MDSHRSDVIRVCLIEDDTFFRSKLERVLTKARDFECDGSFGAAEAALPHIERTKPDIVLLDLSLPGLSGAECLRCLKQRAPQARVVVLTGLPDHAVVFDSLQAGADGFLDKEEFSAQRLLQELREAHEGAHPLSRRARDLALQAFLEYHAQPQKPEILTEREYEVAVLMRQRLSAKEMADKLGISVHTVYAHIRNIFEKTHAHNRMDAIFKLWGVR